jgi:hypothetical protein
VDSDVKVGSTYYYLVSAVNEAGVEGLRAGTPPVTATKSADPTGVSGLSARIVQQEPPRVALSFAPMTGATGYRLRREMYYPSRTDPGMPDFTTASTQQLADLAASMTSTEDSLSSSATRRWVRYVITAVGPGTQLSSPLLAMPVSSSTTGGTTSGGTTGGTTGGTATTTTATLSPTGSTTLTVAVPATVAAGGTASLAAAGGTAARWLSLNDSIATVDASGTVTGRAAGNTQIVALGSASDGSLRVVAIPLAVKP